LAGFACGLSTARDPFTDFTTGGALRIDRALVLTGDHIGIAELEVVVFAACQEYEQEQSEDRM